MNQLPEFRDNYAAGHLSAGNYFIGIVLGLAYNKFKSQNQKSSFVNSILLKFFWYGMVVIGVAVILSSYMFYANNFEKPSLWISLYSVLTKNIWGAFGAVLMFMFVGKKKCK